MLEYWIDLARVVLAQKDELCPLLVEATGFVREFIGPMLHEAAGGAARIAAGYIQALEHEGFSRDEAIRIFTAHTQRITTAIQQQR